MSNIVNYELDDKFPFDLLSLANPQGLQGGAYFSKVRIHSEDSFLFQTPKCFTKNGIIRTGKKIYCDLMFSENDDCFLTWIQNLENAYMHLFMKNEIYGFIMIWKWKI